MIVSFHENPLIKMRLLYLSKLKTLITNMLINWPIFITTNLEASNLIQGSEVMLYSAWIVWPQLLLAWEILDGDFDVGTDGCMFSLERRQEAGATDCLVAGLVAIVAREVHLLRLLLSALKRHKRNLESRTVQISTVQDWRRVQKIVFTEINSYWKCD